jgi:hypothetical protein
MATIFARFTAGRTGPDGEFVPMVRWLVEAQFEPAATLKQSIARAREAAWREALDHAALERERGELF